MNKRLSSEEDSLLNIAQRERERESESRGDANFETQRKKRRVAEVHDW